MIVREWERDDFEKLCLQPDQEYLREWSDNLDYDLINKTGKAWTAVADDGEILIIAGVTYQWENRGLVWSLISDVAGREFIKIHREVLKKLDEFQENCRRLEMTVDVGFPQAHRWAKMLGFSIEGYLRAYRPDGGDVIIYSRVR